MSSMDIYDLVAAAPDDLRNTKYGSKKTRTRPFDRINLYAGPPEHLLEGPPRAADKTHCYAFPNKTGQQVFQKFFPAAPASEVVYKENLHILLLMAHGAKSLTSLLYRSPTAIVDINTA